MPELEEDPFDPENFVERLAWKTTGESFSLKASEDGKKNEVNFDPMKLHDTFEQAIRDLRILQVAMQNKTERLESMCKEEEKRHWQKIGELQNKNKAAFNSFQELDERINFVATKVVHLGDQLESVNTPRARDVEAQKLMNYFAEFLTTGPLISQVFTDPSQLNQAADVIHKLHGIAQELPEEKFREAKDRIGRKYDEIERSLIDEFVKAYNSDDKAKMKEIAGILKQFKGYSQCINAFIELSQAGAFKLKNIFEDVIPLCEKNSVIMKEVFVDPDQVMSKFVLNIYLKNLQDHVKSKLADRSNSELYLKNLYELYLKTSELSKNLSGFNMGSDSAFLSRLTKSIFQSHLDTYYNVEMRYLKEKYSFFLQKYYASVEHQKKQIQSGGLYDLRRNIQAIGTRANIKLGSTSEVCKGEILLSQDLSIKLLHESKLALKRCQMLSRESNIATNAVQIFDIILNYLCVEHIDYALEIGLQGIPVGEQKGPPDIFFFDIVGQCNTIMHLVEKHFTDNLVPLIISTPKHAECLQKKKDIVEHMEVKLDMGIDRTIPAIVGWIRILLQTEQKKTDFKPEIEENVKTVASAACLKVVQYLNAQVENIKESLDGKNVEAVLLELGVQFHQVILKHLKQFQYSSMGAVLVLCDVHEYRKCIKEFKVPVLNSLFHTLHILCSLLVVAPSKVKEACTDDQLVSLDKSIIMNFVQLRADYKMERLGNLFK